MITVYRSCEHTVLIVSSYVDTSEGQMYLNEACQAVNINVLRNNSFVQLIPHMLFLVILWIYGEDPLNLRMQNEKNHVDSDLSDIVKE